MASCFAFAVGFVATSGCSARDRSCLTTVWWGFVAFACGGVADVGWCAVKVRATVFAVAKAGHTVALLVGIFAARPTTIRNTQAFLLIANLVVCASLGASVGCGFAKVAQPLFFADPPYGAIRVLTARLTTACVFATFVATCTRNSRTKGLCNAIGFRDAEFPRPCAKIEALEFLWAFVIRASQHTNLLATDRKTAIARAALCAV